MHLAEKKSLGMQATSIWEQPRERQLRINAMKVDAGC